MSSFIEGDEPDEIYEKRIFVLTDGQVYNKHDIYRQVELKADLAYVYTFGLGSGCDTDLCDTMARKGNGTYSFVPDHSPHLN